MTPFKRLIAALALTAAAITATTVIDTVLTPQGDTTWGAPATQDDTTWGTPPIDAQGDIQIVVPNGDTTWG